MEHFQLVFDCSKKLEAQSDITATAPKKKKKRSKKGGKRNHTLPQLEKERGSSYRVDVCPVFCNEEINQN